MSMEANPEQAVQLGRTRSAQSNVSAALAAASAGVNSAQAQAVRFPGEDGGRSLAEMARSDLDAALQLLADRAQYITGANGAAIALRRSGKKDMLCRASTGSNVPELGALLSTEFGLSGESVRTRQPLRCDDAERDARVNREVCRQMGIASVVVMPVVNDDEVLGVFELFSRQVNAFGERDVSALQRLSEMVETAVRLARAAESVPERRLEAEVPVVESPAPDANGDDDILDDEILETQNPVVEVEAEQFAGNAGIGASGAEALTAEALTEEGSSMAALEALRHPKAGSANDEAASKTPASAAPTVPETPKAALLQEEARPEPPAPTPAPRKPLFWSAALDTSAEAQKPVEADQSHVPPVLRNLRKCEACGFPVSSERTLCVECEEKKWRGQLRRPSPLPQPKAPPLDALRAGLPAKDARPAAPIVADPPSEPVARLMAAAAAQSAGVAPAPAGQGRSAAEAVSALAAPVTQAPPSQAQKNKSKEVTSQPPAMPVTAKPAVDETASAPAPVASESLSPEFVLSAGLEPSQSWFSANKYIVGSVLVVAAIVAAILLLR